MALRIRSAMLFAAVQLICAVFAVSPSFGQAETSEQRVIVTCPAIEEEQRPQVSFFSEPERPVCLVVLGTISRLEEPEGGLGIFELLFG